MTDTTAILIAAAAAASAGWFAPFPATGFVITGAIPFYTVLYLTGIQNSAPLIGAVFSVLGGCAMLRLAVDSRLVARNTSIRVAALLFLGFVAIWYVRWYQDPPSAA